MSFDFIQDDIRVLKMRGDQLPLLNMYSGNQQVIVCEKFVSKYGAIFFLPHLYFFDCSI